MSTTRVRTWRCPQCGIANTATRSRKCQACHALSRPPKRTAKHRRVLHGDTYPLFVRAAEEIHGVTDEACCVCGKPKPAGRKWDRDHGHRKGQVDYGKPRGLACSGNQGCNMLMLPWVTAATASGIYEAKARAGEPDAERWRMIAWYLERVERFYADSE